MLVEHGQWLERLGCQITPVPLGAGQQVTLANQRYQLIPGIAETWELKLCDNWESILTCHKKPVVALRDYGKGRVCVMSDTA